MEISVVERETGWPNVCALYIEASRLKYGVHAYSQRCLNCPVSLSVPSILGGKGIASLIQFYLRKTNKRQRLSYRKKHCQSKHTIS